MKPTWHANGRWRRDGLTIVDVPGQPRDVLHPAERRAAGDHRQIADKRQADHQSVASARHRRRDLSAEAARMMMRHVADLKPGDAVRPFGDDRLWRVVSVRAQGEEHDPRVMVTFGHPVDGETEVLACFSDLVTIA
jgi:hypothetical protein